MTITVSYLAAQIILYAQTTNPVTPVNTPWEHLTLEGALLIAVGIQYKENRAKEEVARILAKEATETIARATEIMSHVAGALERLSQKIEDSQSRQSR